MRVIYGVPNLISNAAVGVVERVEYEYELVDQRIIDLNGPEPTDDEAVFDIQVGQATLYVAIKVKPRRLE